MALFTETEVERANEFIEWFDRLPIKLQARLELRFERIRSHGYLGDCRNLGDGLLELKWKSGWRIYLMRVPGNEKIKFVLLFGGNKNGQKKTSKKRVTSLKDIPVVQLKPGVRFASYDPRDHLRDAKFIAQALIECLQDGDAEAFKEILQGHLEVINKAQFCAKTKIPQRTLYRMLTPEGNPTLETIAKIVHALSA